MTGTCPHRRVHGSSLHVIGFHIATSTSGQRAKLAQTIGARRTKRETEWMKGHRRGRLASPTLSVSISSAISNRPTGRPGTDANGPFRGLAKRQQKQYFPNDHARVHASPCSRHVTRSHMIKDRHGTLTAPRRDIGTQTKRETDRLCLSFGFASLGHRARLIAVSAPLLSNATHAGVAACMKPGLLPLETNARATFPYFFRGFVIRASVP